MKVTFKTLAAFCSITMALTGCTDSNADSTSDSGVTPLIDNPPATSSQMNMVEKDSQDSAVPTHSDSIIQFADSGVDVVKGKAVVSGNTVTISNSGVYELKGKSSDGRIIVDADKDDEVTLVLNGLELTSEIGSPLVCTKAKKLTLHLAEDSENSLSDTSNYSFAKGETEPDAAVYVKADMVINGAGSLYVNGNYADGIKCKDGLKVCTEQGSMLRINSVADGLKGRDYVFLSCGGLEVISTADGIKTTNDEDSTLGYISVDSGEITVTSGEDAIQAESGLAVNGGTFSLKTGGGSASVEHTEEQGFGGGRDFGGKRYDFNELPSDDDDDLPSMKGLKAGGDIVLSGGNITADCADDALHSDGEITISGGVLSLASGDDGVHAEGNIIIKDGELFISTCYEGLEGLCIDISSGTVDLTAFDDGMNAAGGDNGAEFGFGEGSDEYYIAISGGNVSVNSGGDGIDSNGTVALSGGSLTIYGPTNGGNGAIDYARSFAVSGGTLVALGSSQMAQAPSTLSQPCLSINAQVNAGAGIEVRDSADSVVLSVDTPKVVQSLIFSTDKFVEGETYSIYADGVLLAEVTAENGVTGGGASGTGFGGGFGGGHKPDNRHEDRGDFPGLNGEPPVIPEGFDPSDFVASIIPAA